MLTLKAKMRSKTDNLASLRSNGNVPGVVYGASIENTPVSLLLSDFIKVFKTAGESEAITIDIDGKNVPVLIHEIQYDAIRDTPIHIDFYAIDMNKEVIVSVPLEFTGEAPAAKQGLGNLVKVLHEIEIKALPKSLPHEIEVNISSLATLEDQITVGDLTLPSGVSVITKPSEVIAAIATIKEEKESTPVDLSQIEVAKKGKKEEEVTE